MAKLIFCAKIVGTNKKTIVAAILVGCGILPIVICLSVPSLSKYLLQVFGTIVIFTVLWVVFNGGNGSIYDLKKVMRIYKKHLEIATIMFPFQEIENLIFHFEAFRDMRPNSYEPSSEAELHDVWNGKDVFGLENTISFKYKKQNFKYNFYVENQAHFYQFVEMLESLYQSKINFQEENWYGKTFLMQNVNADDYDKLLSQY